MKLLLIVLMILSTCHLLAAKPIITKDTLVIISEGIALRVIETGPKDAQTIVLIPGWCFTADIWNKQIEAVGDNYHIISFDPRSQGSSTIIDHSNSPDDRAADIANLIRILHLDKPVLVGWSQGVQDVAAYVMAYGTKKIRGLVFVDATVSAGATGLDCKIAAMTFGRMSIYVSYQRGYLEGMMPYIFKKPLSQKELNIIVTNAMRTPSSIGVENLMLDFFGKDYRQVFKLIDVPTQLIVAGTAQDKDEQLKQPILNVTTAVVDGAGHAVFYDEPTKFNALLIQFLQEKAIPKKQ